MSVLEYKGMLKHITREVKLEHELAAVGKKACGKFAVCFDKPVGINLPDNNKIPVVTAVVGNRQMFAEAMGVSVSEMSEHFSKAQSNPIPPVYIESKFAPVKELINLDVNLYDLPIPMHHEKDSGQYITAGVVVAKNPETGERNVSIHRLQVTDKNHLGVLLLPRHLMAFQRMAEKKNEALEVAICIGLDPIALLSSQAIAAIGFDEFGVAGALYGKPMELVSGETVNLEYPAHAEIVLEGKILPNIRQPEGPFGEYPKYYGPKSDREVIEITCISSRKEPLFQTIVPATDEHTMLGAVAREGGVLKIIQHAVPTTKAVHLTPGGTGRYHLVIQIEKKNAGEAKNAIFAALGSSQEIKHVVVVDTDVDIFDPIDVNWAIATRCQADRDVFIVSGACGNKLDPSSDDGLSAKMGIDATIPMSEKCTEKFSRIQIPDELNIILEDYIS
jgi:2,5-furandicarboxylate decarboxylase 1